MDCLVIGQSIFGYCPKLDTIKELTQDEGIIVVANKRRNSAYKGDKTKNS
jgi:hypothetical protein